MNDSKELIALRSFVNEQMDALDQYAGMINIVRRVMECDDYLAFRGLQMEAAYFLKDKVFNRKHHADMERKVAANERRSS